MNMLFSPIKTGNMLHFYPVRRHLNLNPGAIFAMLLIMKPMRFIPNLPANYSTKRENCRKLSLQKGNVTIKMIQILTISMVYLPLKIPTVTGRMRNCIRTMSRMRCISMYWRRKKSRGVK